MSKTELNYIVSELIALCQRNDLLPTEAGELADELQSLVSIACYISKSEMQNYLEFDL